MPTPTSASCATVSTVGRSPILVAPIRLPPIARQPRQSLFVRSVVFFAKLRLSVAYVVLSRRKHDFEGGQQVVTPAMTSRRRTRPPDHLLHCSGNEFPSQGRSLTRC